MDRRTVIKKPGEKGYAAAWRYVVSKSGLKGLKKQPEDVSGKALLLLLKTYGETINNTSGEAYIGQNALAEGSGLGVRTVVRAKSLAKRLGYIETLASGIPGQRGERVRALIPGDWETVVTRANAAVAEPEMGASAAPRTAVAADEMGASRPEMGASRAEMGASTGTETLIGTLTRTLEEPATTWPANSWNNNTGRKRGGANTVQYIDPLTAEQRARVNQVWDEAEAAFAADAAAKLSNGEAITHPEWRILLKLQPGLLAPSFD